MAARWIGLARPRPQLSRRLQRRKRKSNPNRHPMDGLRVFGAVCVVGAGLMFNWALFPEAAGQTGSLLDRHLASLVPHLGASAVEAATPTAEAAVKPSVKPIDEEEVRLLAATAWGEARSEGEDGMRAVAHVMVNRVGDRFGSDLKTVILAPKQFSAWNVGDPNRPLVQHPERYAARGGVNRESWETAQQVAREVLSGQSVDPTGGALFYHTRAISPWWSRYGQGRHVIGAHVFYRDVPVQYRAEHRRVTQTAARAPSRATAQAAPGQQRGRRAGRVNGVIRYAPAETPAPAAAQPSAEAAATQPAVSPQATNAAYQAALAQLPTSHSY